jgi:hypothetical protein
MLGVKSKAIPVAGWGLYGWDAKDPILYRPVVPKVYASVPLRAATSSQKHHELGNFHNFISIFNSLS